MPTFSGSKLAWSGKTTENTVFTDSETLHRVPCIRCQTVSHFLENSKTIKSGKTTKKWDTLLTRIHGTRDVWSPMVGSVVSWSQKGHFLTSRKSR